MLRRQIDVLRNESLLSAGMHTAWRYIDIKYHEMAQIGDKESNEKTSEDFHESPGS